MEMFCYQCQETAFNKGCMTKGVCGKEAETSNLMDLLLYVTRGIAIVNKGLREKGEANVEADRFIIDALFCTITNANFDNESIRKRITAALVWKDKLSGKAKKRGIEIPDFEEVYFECKPDQYLDFKAMASPLSEENNDIRGLKQLALFGLKGAAAYTQHALNLGFEDDDIYTMMENTLKEISRKDIDAKELTSLVLSVGECALKSMMLLDKANTTRYGNPEITEVELGVRDRPGILISGHDLHDLENLLEQTKNKGVDVYTHSEMLPGQYYPFFKKYPHFAGNYGNAWWKQKEEFESFNGVIFFTSNCIVPPLKSATYLDRIYTTGPTGYPGAHYIDAAKDGKPIDFSKMIEHAQRCAPPKQIESGKLIGGFAHHQVIALADKILAAVKSGAIKKFVVMAGCDGRMKSREYYTDFAKALPRDCVILTAGCAKYRYNKLGLGDINGIPRVLDAGQCNDSFSLIVIASALRDALGLKNVNELPIVFNIAWYEQKAVAVLLALLSVGIKDIHVGPTLPAFYTPNILNVLKEHFNIGTISTVEQDIKEMIG